MQKKVSQSMLLENGRSKTQDIPTAGTEDALESPALKGSIDIHHPEVPASPVLSNGDNANTNGVILVEEPEPLSDHEEVRVVHEDDKTLGGDNTPVSPSYTTLPASSRDSTPIPSSPTIPQVLHAGDPFIYASTPVSSI